MAEKLQKREEKIFYQALEKSHGQREAYLTEVCGDDHKLYGRIEALLKANDLEDNFLQSPFLDSQLTLDNPPHIESPGAVIGRYKLLEKIGEGGMAVVYMAEQERPIRRKVALKIIKLGMDTKSVIARFEAERQALAMMDHPNIAKVLDAGATETGRPYFVMELVTGVSITEYCDKNNLSTKERLALFIQVCNAVQHAHQKGIIHRDIKPTNVMVTRHEARPVPKVIDFGIAKAINQKLTEKTLFTRYAHIIGTPAYMSPEQADLGDMDVDTRSDIYSLGVLLYELLTGATPFSEEELRKAGYIEMQRVIREQQPPKPSTKLSTIGETLTDIAKCRGCTPDLLTKTVRGDLDWIVMKSLEKDRSRRYETANSLALDLRRHLDDEPVLAHAPGRIYCLQKFLRRHRTRVVAVLALAVLIGSLVMTLLIWNKNRSQLAEAKAIKDRNTLSEALEARVQGDPDAALITVESILYSQHVGAEARLLHARLVLDLLGPTAAIQELEALLSESEEIPEEIAGKAHFLLAKMYYDGDPDAPGRTEEYHAKWKYHSEQARLLLPPIADAYLLQAISTGTVRKTFELLDQALELDDKHYDSLRERVYLHYLNKDYFEMAMDASRMIGIRPEDGLGYSLRAVARRELKQFDGVIEDHNRAIERSPDEPEFYDQRRRTYMELDQYENALKDARKCARLDPNESVYRFNVFCDLTTLGQYEEARTEYDEIIASGIELWRLGASAAKQVSDSLNAGRPWHPDENPPVGHHFWEMFKAEDYHSQWVAKAQRIIMNGFRSDWSPQGNELAYSCGLAGSTGIAILNCQTGKTRLLTIPGRDPVWSPNGQYIAYARNRKVLPLHGIAAAHEGRLIDEDLDEIWLVKTDGTEDPKFLVRGSWPQWSRYSNRIFFRPPGNVDKLYSISPDGKDVRHLMLCPDQFPVISPDDRYVAYSKQNYVQVRDITSGRLVAHWLAPVEVRNIGLGWSPDGQTLSIGVFGDLGNSKGLWIYDLKRETAIQVFGGDCWFSSWSQPELGQIAIQKGYGIQYYEIWTMPTTALRTSQTVEEHVQNAIDLYTERIQTEPENAASYASRAAYRIYMNDAEGAFADLELYESLVNNPMKKGAAYFWLGWYLCHVPQDRVDPEIAVKLLDRAYVLNSDRNNEWNVGALGIAHYRAGHWKDAIDWIGRAIEMSRDGGINYYAFIMAMAHWQVGDKDQAQTCYEKTVAWMSNRIAEGKPPLQPAWCFYMEAAELMGLKTELFDDEAPTTGKQQPFQQSAPQSTERTIENKNGKEVKPELTEN